MVSIVIHQDTQVLSAKLLFSQSALSMECCLELFLPRGRTLHFPLLNFMRLLPSDVSSLPWFMSMIAHQSGLLATPPSFVLFVNLLKVHSVPSSRSLMKRPEYRLLEHTSNDLLPIGLFAADRNPLDLAVQPVFNPPCCSVT